MRTLVILAIGVVTATLATVASELDLMSLTAPARDQRLAAFTVPRVRVPEQTLSSEALAGRVTMINVWATWCVPCRREHGVLLGIARESSVAIYGLNYRDRREDAVRWLETLGDPYVASGFDADGTVAEALAVYGTPETYVVAADGTVAYRHLGPVTDEVWRNTLRPLIARLGEDPG
jgi:cytochrome c biogenesis protein CcmG/thiol:disulfide interchange protein DsbE